MGMILDDDTPSNISGKIKELLYTKSMENIEEIKPHVASQLFSTLNDEE